MSIVSVHVMWSADLMDRCSLEEKERIERNMESSIGIFLYGSTSASEIPMLMQRLISEFPFSVVASHYIVAANYMVVFLDVFDIPHYRICYPTAYPKLH